MATTFKAKYDYVELLVEPHDDHWRLTLRDPRHDEYVEHDETFATAVDARDAALAMAQNHINVKHNDTLLTRAALSWEVN